MPLLERLLRALGYIRPARLSFSLDQELIQSLQVLSEQEQRPPEELASELLSFALEQRQVADERLERWHTLTPREQQVAALACLSYTNRQIAARLVISPETVKTHMRNLLRKFDLHSKVELRQALAEWDFSAWEDSLPGG